MERIVLAYSGGLDTSVAIPWLAETYGAEVIAVTMDLGQGENLEAARERALATGAVNAYVVDVQEEFAREYILPALQAGAIYEDRYPLATALGRPLIAKKLVEVAHLEKAGAIAHGCTGKGNDQVRLDVSARALDPAIKVYAPGRVWGMTRADEIEYARVRGIPVPVTKESPYSTDENLWGRSIECGILEDPWAEPPEDAFALTRSGADCPDQPASLELTFEAGVPVEVNGVRDAAHRTDSQRRDDRGRPRRRPDRHDREPAGGHQVARGLRVAGGRRAPRGASRTRVARDAARPAAAQARARRRRTPTWSTTASGSRRRGRRSTPSWRPSSRR